MKYTRVVLSWVGWVACLVFGIVLGGLLHCGFRGALLYAALFALASSVVTFVVVWTTCLVRERLNPPAATTSNLGLLQGNYVLTSCFMFVFGLILGFVSVRLFGAECI